MLKFLFKNTLNFKCLVISFFLLISCQIYAFETTENDDFPSFLLRVELLKNESPSQALRLLNTYKSKYIYLKLEEQLKYINLEAQIYLDQAQFQAAKIATDKALLLTARLSSPSIVIAELFYSRGFAIESLGNLTQATQDYLSGLELSKSLNNKKFIATGLVNLGAIYYLTEKYERSLIILNNALLIANELNDDELLGTVNSELGILYSYLRQEVKSMQFYQKSYVHFNRAGKEFLAINSLRNIAINHAMNARYEQAITLYKKIIASADRFANDELMGSVYSGMAWAHLNREDRSPEAAYQYILIAGQYVANTQQYGSQLFHATDKAYILFELKRYEEALESIDAASKLTSSQAAHLVTNSTLDILNLKAEVYFAMEEFELAYQYQSEYLEYGLTLQDRHNTEAIEELRLKYESEQSDLQRKILVEKQNVQSLKLNEVKKQAYNRQVFIVLSALIALSLAWLLVRTFKGKKYLFNVKQLDELTGLINRRKIINLGEKALAHAQQSNKAFNILIFSIKHYKKICLQSSNDSKNELIKLAVDLGKQCLKNNEKLARLGENEFLVLFDHENTQRSIEFSQQLHKLIVTYPWGNTNTQAFSIIIGSAAIDNNKQQSFSSLIKNTKLSLKNKSQKALDVGGS